MNGHQTIEWGRLRLIELLCCKGQPHLEYAATFFACHGQAREEAKIYRLFRKSQFCALPCYTCTKLSSHIIHLKASVEQ
jgi:hypothetical protein